MIDMWAHSGAISRTEAKELTEFLDEQLYQGFLDYIDGLVYQGAVSDDEAEELQNWIEVEDNG